MIQHWTFRVTAVAAAIAAGLAAAPRIARAAEEGEETTASPLTERQRALHVLNRLGFGPRPGDVERVEQMGVEKYIEVQLHPESIDDAAIEEKLAAFDTLALPSHKLVGPYYEEIRGFIAMQAATGDTSDMKLRYGVDVPKPQDEKDKPEATEAEKAPPAKTGEAMGMGDGMQMLARNVSLRALGELQTAKVMRAAESERQLNEVLVDFWSNHFNVDVKKDACRVYKIVDDREVIRPHVLGKFRTMLGASAASPAMLTYLDNAENSAPHEVTQLEQELAYLAVKGLFGIEMDGLKPQGKTITQGGLNENYARELLELHTLGVDGGYTQKDVEEVARCFTGWAVDPFGGKFSFEGKRHDDGPKAVLGHAIPAGGGITDGLAVLDILARHPSTAKFISTKLCRRLVADEPPASLVERAAAKFTETDGDLREVVRTIVTSDEFFSRSTYRAKLKSPFEFAVSAVRATGAAVEPRPQGFVTVRMRHVLEGAATTGFNAEALSAARMKTLNWHVFDMGQPLFACQPPTGYPEDSHKWVSSGALIARLNFAVALTSGNVTDASVPRAVLEPEGESQSAEQILQDVLDKTLYGEVTDPTMATLMRKATGETEPTALSERRRLLGLVLGTPEFQRR